MLRRPQIGRNEEDPVRLALVQLVVGGYIAAQLSEVILARARPTIGFFLSKQLRESSMDPRGPAREKGSGVEWRGEKGREEARARAEREGEEINFSPLGCSVSL